MTGPLRGRGVLAIWNGIAPGHDGEFLRWHVNEHIPERLSVPGFLRARRYVALSGAPRYFNFYEVEAPEVLQAQPYLDRLNAPSDWTRAVVPQFTDTSRTICRVVESRGYGVAGNLVTLRLSTSAEGLGPILDQLAAHPDVSAVHLLEQAGGAGGTAESRMRAQPDQAVGAILMVEGVDPVALGAAVAHVAPDDAVVAATGAAPERRGIYRLDFLMDRGDVVHD